MSATVLIIGCGIAGPVLAILLKQKGYKPVVFEKVRELGDAGASTMLMPNGLKVLALVDLADKLSNSTHHLAEFRDQTSSGSILGVSDVPCTFRDRYGRPAAGVKRAALNLQLKQSLADNDIELHEGWKLIGIRESDDEIIADFDGGRSMRGAFLVGCDGIKSASREAMMKIKGISEGVPSFTGLSQTGGFSPTPPSLKERPSLLNIYGAGAHFMTYPISKTHSTWAITLPDTTDAQESWGLYSPSQLSDLKPKLLQQFSQWTSPVPEIIRSAERLLKFGLYDRGELSPEQWHSRRCVLVGDAAHPTSPHLGQGANQALEDCYHLSTLLPTITPHTPTPLSTQDLEQIFQLFAEKRQARTAALVSGARAQGRLRVVTDGPLACQERDEAVRTMWSDERGVQEKYDGLLKEPFQVAVSSKL